MDIPFEIFFGFIVISISMGVIGIWKQIPLLMFIAGAFIAFWGIITDNVIMGIMPLSSTDVGATTNYVMIDNPYPFTEYPKILFALVGSLISIGGALVWKATES